MLKMQVSLLDIMYVLGYFYLDKSIH